MSQIEPDVWSNRKGQVIGIRKDLGSPHIMSHNLVLTVECRVGLTLAQATDF